MSTNLRLVAYVDPDDFVREVAAPMAADAIANNVCLILADQMAAKPEAGQRRYGVFVGENCVLAAWMTPPFRLGLADLGDGAEAAGVLARHLKTQGATIPGVIGPRRLADAFAAAWGGRADPEFTMEQNFYRIERVSAPYGAAGSMRLAQATERDLLADWLAHFAEDASLPPSERGRDFAMPRVDRALADGCAYVWDAGGAPVACALERPFRQAGARISTVFTDRDQRGRGYGGALTAALSQRILDSGRWCVLFADADNALTNRLYQRLGYRFQAVYSDIHFVQD